MGNRNALFREEEHPFLREPLGFHIVEFFNSHHPDPNDSDEREDDMNDRFPAGMFRFEKRL